MTERMTLEEYRKVTGEKPHKYGAKATKVDGINFPSTREANRYRQLRLLEKGGVISDLKISAIAEDKAELTFEIVVNSMHVCNYIADFKYWHVKQKRMIVEDTKGYRTPVYYLKRKLVRACHGVEILET